jgi:hypothetical protein
MTEYQGQIQQLSKLIKKWNLINNSSTLDFSTFSKKLLNALHKGASVEKIKGIIESELPISFGLFTWEFDSEALTNEIVDWWQG